MADTPVLGTGFSGFDSRRGHKGRHVQAVKRLGFQLRFHGFESRWRYKLPANYFPAYEMPDYAGAARPCRCLSMIANLFAGVA
jgi:hypothetical protein